MDAFKYLLSVIDNASHDYDGLSKDERRVIKSDLKNLFDFPLKKSPTLGKKPHLKAGILKKTASLPKEIQKRVLHLVENRETNLFRVLCFVFYVVFCCVV